MKFSMWTETKAASIYGKNVKAKENIKRGFTMMFSLMVDDVCQVSVLQSFVSRDRSNCSRAAIGF